MTKSNVQKQMSGEPGGASRNETKGSNAAMERFLSEDDPLKKSLVAGKEKDKDKKEVAEPNTLDKDAMWTDLNRGKDQRQH